MSWPDYAILAVVAISVLVGALRGFIKEVFSLFVWAAAFFVAYHYGGDVAAMMEGAVSLPSARTAMGFIGLFVAVLLVGGLLNYLLGRLVASTGLSGTDRLLGGLFGAARGLALVVATLLVAGLTPIPADPWWTESTTISRMMPLVGWAASYLPESIAQHVDFEPEMEKSPDKAGTGADTPEGGAPEAEQPESSIPEARTPGGETAELEEATVGAGRTGRFPVGAGPLSGSASGLTAHAGASAC
jgi:membrane protein required for colicin V production